MKYNLFLFILVSTVLTAIGLTNPKVPDNTITIKSGRDTFNVSMEKIWPQEVNIGEIKKAEYHLISCVAQRNDTMLVLSNTPKMFFNDFYQFNSKEHIIETFSNSNVKFYYDPNCAPNYADIVSRYGEIKDSISYIGRDPHYALDGGILVTNRLFTISKHCKIGTGIDELFKFLGLTSLGISIPNWDDGNGYIVINPELKDINAPKNFDVYNNYSYKIELKIVSGRIYSIKFGYDWDETDKFFFYNKREFPIDFQKRK